MRKNVTGFHQYYFSNYFLKSRIIEQHFFFKLKLSICKYFSFNYFSIFSVKGSAGFRQFSRVIQLGNFEASYDLLVVHLLKQVNDNIVRAFIVQINRIHLFNFISQTTRFKFVVKGKYMLYQLIGIGKQITLLVFYLLHCQEILT